LLRWYKIKKREGDIFLNGINYGKKVNVIVDILSEEKNVLNKPKLPRRLIKCFPQLRTTNI